MNTTGYTLHGYKTHRRTLPLSGRHGTCLVLTNYPPHNV